jgi:hypothetical protein
MARIFIMNACSIEIFNMYNIVGLWLLGVELQLVLVKRVIREVDNGAFQKKQEVDGIW